MRYFAIILFCSFTAAVQAQFSNYAGVDRRISNPVTSQPRGEKPDPAAMVEKSMAKLTEALSLDSFQQAVIRQIVEENQRDEEKVYTEQIPDESKMEKIMLIREKASKKIKEVLSPEQIKAYENMAKSKKKK